ncbi:MAG: DUF2254 domain-containing protein [Pedobacter sp.]
MKTRLINLWEKLRSNYWFLPGLMALGAVVLVISLGSIDRRWEVTVTKGVAWMGGNEPEGARAFLSTVAGAMVTVTGVVFSITIVALSLASQQFGPRLLNSFMRDRANQVVFGSFIGTYLYCLLVLRTIHGSGPEGFVPQLSLLVGFLLAVFSVAVLIFFIHHVADSIQAMTVIANVSEDLEHAIVRDFPEHDDGLPAKGREALRPGELPEDFDSAARPIGAHSSGYLQAVNISGLLKLAIDHDLLLRLEFRPGDFVTRGTPLAYVWSADGARPAELADAVKGAFIVGAKRSPEQDIEHLINQLVEVAVRALSPGINDPFTAINCIDYLGSALANLARRRLPVPWHFDAEDRLRLITHPQTFDGALSAAVDQIRQHGRRDVAVTIRLLEMLATLLSVTCREEQRRALARQAAMIERGSRDGLPAEEDRRDVHQRYLAVFQALEEHFGFCGDLD